MRSVVKPFDVSLPGAPLRQPCARRSSRSLLRAADVPLVVLVVLVMPAAHRRIQTRSLAPSASRPRLCVLAHCPIKLVRIGSSHLLQIVIRDISTQSLMATAACQHFAGGGDCTDHRFDLGAVQVRWRSVYFTPQRRRHLQHAS